ncbi:MAG: ABC transporter permease [Bdellovibrionales bacterium]|nr:ABC transporter permease [Bdellovibrionales bacterium]
MSEKLRERVNHYLDLIVLTIVGVIEEFIYEVGCVMSFGAYSMGTFFKKPYRMKEFIQQMEFIGNKSIFIVVLTGTFTGMALAFQVYLGFRMVNATSLTGPIVAMGIARELGPVLTGLIVAARAGGAMAANLGSMRVSEQIDALEVMGVDPLEYLVAPRMWASVVALPLLTGVFDFTAMVGSYFLCIHVLEMDEAIFWDKTSLWLNPNHINEGLIKAAVFGAVFSLICCYRGFKTTGGARGVGDSTNRGVVLSMVMIIILDFFLMNLIDIYYKVTT